MEEDKYYIKISPEVLLSDLVQVPYTGTPIYYTVLTGDTNNCCLITGYTTNINYPTGSTGYYLPMPDLLSGGTNGSSLLTGLTIPILIRQTAVDIGYYSVFDGAIMQMDVVKNFVFSAATGSPYTYYFYNTSEKEYKTFLELSNYVVDWGDNTSQPITTFSPNNISHLYLNDGEYTITLKQTTPWGINTVKKTIVVPFTGTTIPNPNGTAYFTPNIGSWSATPISYDYIFTGDSNNNVSAQVSSNYVTTPFMVTGYTKSRITELSRYGVNKYQLNVPVLKNNTPFGIISAITATYTGYTIEGVQYIDFEDGTTTYKFDSEGLTSNWLEQMALTKQEVLMNIVSDPEIQSDIFIERGKNSALERIERMGEVDNIGDLESYGYGFFKVVEQ